MANPTEDILESIVEKHFDSFQDSIFQDLKKLYLRIAGLPNQSVTLIRLQERAKELNSGSKSKPDGLMYPSSDTRGLMSPKAVLIDYKSSRAHNQKGKLVTQFKKYAVDFPLPLIVFATWHYAEKDELDICQKAGLSRNKNVYFLHSSMQQMIALSMKTDGDAMFVQNENDDYEYAMGDPLTFSSKFAIPEPITRAGEPWPDSKKRNNAFKIVASNPGLTRQALEKIASKKGLPVDFGLVLGNSSERIKFQDKGLSQNPKTYTLEWPLYKSGHNA